MRDFTLTRYEGLLQALEAEGIPIYGVKAWFEASPEAGALIRHDVDRRPMNALRMAQLEHRRGLRTSYYFRIARESFKPHIIQDIHRLGHEIGYHYEDLSSAHGDIARAVGLFAEHLSMLREYVPVETIAMHSCPLSPHDDRDLWKKEDFRRFGILADAFLTLDYRDCYYITDSGRTWGDTRANLRDHVVGAKTAPVTSTKGLVAFVRSNRTAKFAIVCHPERWDDNICLWGTQFIRDRLSNFIKRGLCRVRRR